MRIVTIGAYGFRESEFFDCLVRANVDTFCDIRRRRGMRGRQYAFANSARLQSRLKELGIHYVHIKELAPTDAVRAAQHEADLQSGIAKRDRSELTAAFVDAYERECLQRFELRSFQSHVPDASRVVALFCVERAPAACHRSLVAERLKRECGFEVEHLT